MSPRRGGEWGVGGHCLFSPPAQRSAARAPWLASDGRGVCREDGHSGGGAAAHEPPSRAGWGPRAGPMWCAARDQECTPVPSSRQKHPAAGVFPQLSATGGVFPRPSPPALSVSRPPLSFVPPPRPPASVFWLAHVATCARFVLWRGRGGEGRPRTHGREARAVGCGA